MILNNKPEWFEIVEADGPAVPLKKSKTLPVAAILATTVIIGFGAAVAQIQQISPATAVQENILLANSMSPIEVSPDSAAVAATTTRLVNPSIAMLPTTGDDEEEDDQEEEDEQDDESEDEDADEESDDYEDEFEEE